MVGVRRERPPAREGRVRLPLELDRDGAGAEAFYVDAGHSTEARLGRADRRPERGRAGDEGGPGVGHVLVGAVAVGRFPDPLLSDRRGGPALRDDQVRQDQRVGRCERYGAG